MSLKTRRLIVFSVVVPLFTILHGLKGIHIPSVNHWIAYGVAMVGVLFFSGSSKKIDNN